MAAQDRGGIFRFWQALRLPMEGTQNAAALEAGSCRQDGKGFMNAKTPQAKSSEETIAGLREAVLRRLTYTIGKDPRLGAFAGLVSGDRARRPRPSSWIAG